MIVARLIGGLGNQLFQYAAARRLAKIHGSVVKIDASGFETYKLHQYALQHFNIQERFASNAEVASLTLRQILPLQILRRILKRPPKLAATHIKEKNPFCHEPAILNLPDDVYLEGYWQSEKYFSDIEDIIRREFTVKTPPSGRNQALAERIESCESVALHIRRGDYISNRNTRKLYDICGLDYYFRCVENMAAAVKRPHFFVFSDEPRWALDNLNLDYPATVVDCNNADTNYEDIRLMSQCKHNIIANSTFSWWGAWLNKNPGKIVMAPRKWGNSAFFDTCDLIPDNWIQL